MTPRIYNPYPQYTGFPRYWEEVEAGKVVVEVVVEAASERFRVYRSLEPVFHRLHHAPGSTD